MLSLTSVYTAVQMLKIYPYAIFIISNHNYLKMMTHSAITCNLFYIAYKKYSYKNIYLWIVHIDDEHKVYLITILLLYLTSIFICSKLWCIYFIATKSQTVKVFLLCVFFWCIEFVGKRRWKKCSMEITQVKTWNKRMLFYAY